MNDGLRFMLLCTCVLIKYVYTCKHVYVSIHSYMYAQMHTCMYVYVCILYVNNFLNLYVYICILMYMYLYMNGGTYVCMYVCLYANLLGSDHLATLPKSKKVEAIFSDLALLKTHKANAQPLADEKATVEQLRMRLAHVMKTYGTDVFILYDMLYMSVCCGSIVSYVYALKYASSSP